MSYQCSFDKLQEGDYFLFHSIRCVKKKVQKEEDYMFNSLMLGTSIKLFFRPEMLVTKLETQ